MGHDSIDKILAARRVAEKPQDSPEIEDKFFSILVGDGLQEHFLELQFRIGIRACFSYTDLLWFNFDPEAGCIDLEFGGYLVTIKGRGLCPKLFNGIKSKRVAWVKEADTEAQDHKDNETFVSEITITPPQASREDQADT